MLKWENLKLGLPPLAVNQLQKLIYSLFYEQLPILTVVCPALLENNVVETSTAVIYYLRCVLKMA